MIHIAIVVVRLAMKLEIVIQIFSHPSLGANRHRLVDLSITLIYQTSCINTTRRNLFIR